MRPLTIVLFISLAGVTAPGSAAAQHVSDIGNYRQLRAAKLRELAALEEQLVELRARRARLEARIAQLEAPMLRDLPRLTILDYPRLRTAELLVRTHPPSSDVYLVPLWNAQNEPARLDALRPNGEFYKGAITDSAGLRILEKETAYLLILKPRSGGCRPEQRRVYLDGDRLIEETVRFVC